MEEGALFLAAHAAIRGSSSTKGCSGRYCGNAVYKSSNMDGVNVMVSSRSSCRNSCNVVTWVGYS